MTFTFGFDTWFKVTTFTESSIYVKFEPDRAKGREDVF